VLTRRRSLLLARLPFVSFAIVGKARREPCKALKSPPSHEEVDNEDDEQYAANSAPHHGAAVIVAPATAEQYQENQNDQENVHKSEFVPGLA
jgi:hypothetical protein